MTKAVLAFLSVVMALSSHAETMRVSVSEPVVRRDLPSGSGISWFGGRYFAIGDDAPYLFQLDRKFKITDRHLLTAYQVQNNGRIAKDIKPDYEAMASVPWKGSVWNLILGSGSQRGTRETGHLVSTDGKGTSHARDLGPLYRRFATLAGFELEQTINIEALAIAGGTAYFFNRGNVGRNIIFKAPLSDVIRYMTGGIETIDDVQLFEAQLPRWKGVQAGFSGADFWPEINSLIFSASVEATKNAYDDGSVLGSYLGLIPLSMLTNGAGLDLTASAHLVTRNGVPVATKVESVALRKSNRTRAKGVLISDNDDGKSEFFNVSLTIEPGSTP